MMIHLLISMDQDKIYNKTWEKPNKKDKRFKKKILNLAQKSDNVEHKKGQIL